MIVAMLPRFRLLATALVLALSFGALAATGCGRANDEADEEGASGLEGPGIDPPFAVEGDLDGLLLVWFDDEGPHTASSRDEIPDAARQHVRVSSLRAAPGDHLDAEQIYVADLRAPNDDGGYVVRIVDREAFDAMVDEAQGVVEEPAVVAAADNVVDEGAEPSDAPAQHDPAQQADADVIIYGADWCGACRSTARYLTQRGVPFVEKNVERDPGARAEMNRKAQAAGVRPSGIPVIDFRGTILNGFDPNRLGQLISAGS